MPVAEDAAPPSTLIASASGSLEDLISRVSPAVVTIEVASSRGSGFFVTPDTILTNVHVVTAGTSVIIRRPDGSTTTARIETQSAPYDIAVLKVSSPLPDQPTIGMGSAAGVRVGQEVIAIGTPLGFLQNTVSRGIVSALRAVDGATMIQTDAAINPGNSGGPLLDRAGTAIGIIKSGYSGRNGLSFAVAIDHARAVLAGQSTPPPSVTATPSAYQPLSPAVASPTDQRRADGSKTYEQILTQLGQRADALDGRWRNFKSSCYEGRVVGSFDRDWFALWEPRAMQGTVSPGCGPYFNEIRREAFAIRDAVSAAEEAARRADVFPGTRRDALRRFRLDYAGWGRCGREGQNEKQSLAAPDADPALPACPAPPAQLPAISSERADRHRCPQAARLRHRYLHSEPAAPAREARSSDRVRRTVPARRPRGAVVAWNEFPRGA
jgi:hypothetical protein